MNRSEDQGAKMETGVSNVAKLMLHLQANDAKGAKQLFKTKVDSPWELAWALARLGREPSLPPTMPFGMKLTVAGWRAFKGDDFALAHEKFALALATTTCDFPWCSLGLARIYTNSGSWALARDWAVTAFSSAQRAHDGVMMSRALGALGEIFLRGGHPKNAWECFDLSSKVLPAGVASSPRQFGYLASALMRTGDLSRARQLLMSAIHLTGKSSSADLAYYFVRLLFLELQSGQVGLSDDLLASRSYDQKRPRALGFLAAGKALRAYQGGKHERVVSHLRQGSDLLETDRSWAGHWLKKLLAFAEDREPPAEPRFEFTPFAPPAQDSILVAPWQETKLSNQGFAALSQADNLDEGFACWRLFFI